MMYETWLETDLKKMPEVIHLRGNLFSQDNMGNKIGVHVYEDEAPVASLGGTITGWILRDDDTSVMVTGETSGGDAWIILPEEAYGVPGPVTIAIRHTATADDDSPRTSLAVCTAYVYRTISDTMVDPGDVLPSLDELVAKINELESRVTTAMQSISNAVTEANTAKREAVNAKTDAVTAKDEAVAAANSLKGATASTVTLQPGSYATVSLNNTDGVFHFSFGIPRGNKGNTGATPNLTIGTVTTLPEDSTATASITGTPENPVLNLGIPKGEAGSISNASANTLPMSTSDPTTIKEAIENAIKIVTISNLTTLAHTLTDAEITADMVVVGSVLSNPAAQLCDWQVTAANGSLTITKLGTKTGIGYGGTDITLYLARTYSSTAQTSTIKKGFAAAPAGAFYSWTFTTADDDSIFAPGVSDGRIIVYRSGDVISVRLLSVTFNTASSAGSGRLVATLPENCKLLLMSQGIFTSGGDYRGGIAITGAGGEINLTPWGTDIPAGTAITPSMSIFNIARDHDDQDMTGYTLTTP